MKHHTNLTIKLGKNHSQFKARSKRPSLINYKELKSKANMNSGYLLKLWLPHGVIQGQEYIALNPTRHDRHLGSFRINMRSGRWADFATSDRGGDLIALLAYLEHSSNSEAAYKIAALLGLEEA